MTGKVEEVREVRGVRERQEIHDVKDRFIPTDGMCERHETV